MELQFDNKVLQEFFTKVLVGVRPLDTTNRVLSEFVDLDVKAEKIAKVIHKNQYMERALLSAVNSLGLKDVVPSLESAVVLLGMQKTRDFICGVQLLRKFDDIHLDMSKDALSKFKPAGRLKYALKAEEVARTRKLGAPELAYVAGLIYDYFAAVAAKNFKLGKYFDECLEEVFKHSVTAGRLAVALSEVLPGFTQQKYAFSAGLVHDVGKLVMELLYAPNKKPSYQGFKKGLEKNKPARLMRMGLEAHLFGMTHEYFSAMCVSQFTPLRAIDKAILFHHDPHLLRYANKELHQLASLLSLSSTIANTFMIPKDASDKIFTSWISGELKGFKVEAQKIIEALGRYAAQGESGAPTPKES